MYTGFYELRQEPFHVTPDPDFLFPSPAHKEALAAIIYGIEQRKGFVAITGEVGVGKTTILRSYLDFADRQNLKLIYIYNSALTFDELVTTLLQELGVPERPPSTFQAVTRLHEELIEVYRKNQTVVLIIDEAQNMPVETLESLRMLSNLETVTEKLIQIMLIGQPEFDELLQQHRLRQLKQRIAIHARIGPLNVEDSIAYLEHRIDKVALGTKPVFSKNALRLIAEASQGIPRNLNIISDNALITGFGYQVRPVNARIVKEVLADRGLTESAPDVRRSRIAWVAGGAAAAAVAATVAFLAVSPDLMSWGERQLARSPAPADRTASAPPVPTERSIASAGNRVDQTPPEVRDRPASGAATAPAASPTPAPGPETRATPAPPAPPPAPRASAPSVETRTLPAPPPPPPSPPEREPTRQAPPAAASPSPPVQIPPRAPEIARAEPSPARIAPLTPPPELAPPAATEPPPAARSPEPEPPARSGAIDARPPSEPPPPARTTTRRGEPIPLAAPAPARPAPTPPPARPSPSIAAVTPAPPAPPPAPTVPSVMMPSASGSGIAANAPAAFEPAPRRGAPPAASSAALAPAPVPAPAAPAGRSDPFTRTVRVGDSLWTLVEDVYGFVNPTVVRRVQDANPNIRNINVLTPGQEVVFPRVPEMAFDRGTSLFESTPPTGQSR